MINMDIATKCHKCGQFCHTEVQHKKMGKRKLKRVIESCLKCESPMGGKLIVKVGEWK